jgi:hypothetical protein
MLGGHRLSRTAYAVKRLPIAPVAPTTIPAKGSSTNSANRIPAPTSIPTKAAASRNMAPNCVLRCLRLRYFRRLFSLRSGSAGANVTSGSTSIATKTIATPTAMAANLASAESTARAAALQLPQAQCRPRRSRGELVHSLDFAEQGTCSSRSCLGVARAARGAGWPASRLHRRRSGSDGRYRWRAPRNGSSRGETLGTPPSKLPGCRNSSTFRPLAAEFFSRAAGSAVPDPRRS